MVAVGCAAEWSLCYALEITVPTLPAKLWWASLEFLGIVFIPLGIFSFGLHYSGRGRWLTRFRLGLLMLIPVLTLLAVITNPYHHLIWAEISLSSANTLAPLTLQHGWAFWVLVIYSYLLLVVTTAIFLQAALQARGLYRYQAIIMLAGLTIPWIGNFFYISGLTPLPGIDLTPVAFTLTNAALVLGFLRYRLVGLLPIAQESIFSAIGDGVIVVNLNGDLVEINTAGQAMLGQTAETLIGQQVSRLLPEWPTWTAAPAGEYREVVLGEALSSRTYSLKITPVYNSGHLNDPGQRLGSVAIFTDITELKQAQQQMLLQVTALESVENGILITGPQGSIQWANPAFTRLTGYTLAEAIGQNPRLLKSGRHPQELYQVLWKTILAGKPWHGELYNRRKDGSFYYEELTITPLLQDGAITHFIAVVQDISERKRVEEQLRLAHQQALEANRLKTQLLANVSHDLRTPLGAIMGFAEVLEADVIGPLNAEQRAVVTDILDSAKELLGYVNNLIGQAQLETGKVVMKARLFNPEELVTVARSTAGLAARKKGLTQDYQIDPALPTLLVGDPYWLSHIIQNLVGNAVKFTETGGISLRLFLPDPEHWAIQVSDTGVGIPDQARGAIFDPFWQADYSITRRHSGSGLGLAIVKELTTLMNGTIDLTSEVGQGTVFTITLPLISMPEKTA